MQIKDLIRNSGIRFRGNCLIKERVARGVACNSKAVKDGFVFVAIKGNREDGTRFIPEALKNGAKVIIVEGLKSRYKIPDSKNINFIRVENARHALAQLAAEFYGRPAQKMKVIGITGTNGKTTITYLLEDLLKNNQTPCAVIGTVNHRFKNKIIPSKNTTPGPVELQSMLADMYKRKAKYVAMEVSSHALDQGRTLGVDFHSAIFTNLTQDHLDYHTTLEDYFLAKAKLFRALPARGFAVLNNDDKYSRRLKKLTRAHVVTYGIDVPSDVTAEDLEFDICETRFNICSAGGKTAVRTRLIGKHNVYNILAVAAWAVEERVPLIYLKKTLNEFSCIPGRLEKMAAGKAGPCVFVDYAHTEDALKNVITSLRQLSDNRIIAVFGCGGERDKSKRPKMGRAVTELCDYAIITNDNPRSEDPAEIIADIEKGICKDNFCVIQDRRKAIRKSISMAAAGDIVLIAGKGHEDYQILNGRTIHFDDREEVRACLASRNY